jgi:hypothetical protein
MVVGFTYASLIIRTEVVRLILMCGVLETICWWDKVFGLNIYYENVNYKILSQQ